MMNKKDWIEGLLFAGLRYLAIILVVAGLLTLAFQLLNSWPAFNPSYLGYFLASTMLRPAIIIITGLLLLASSRRLASCLSGNRDSDPEE